MLSPRPISRHAILLAATLSVLPAAQPPPSEIRTRAWDALLSRIQEQKYIDHSLAVEAIMRELAGAKDDKEEWGAVGLLHDIDIATTSSDLSMHGLVAVQILRDFGFSPAIVYAVKAHDDRAGAPRKSRLDHAIYCADQLYWLASAAGAPFQSEKLNAADPEALWKQAQESATKQPVLVETTAECAAIGFTMPKALAATQAASRKSPAKAANP